jgi:hypothetical protein
MKMQAPPATLTSLIISNNHATGGVGGSGGIGGKADGLSSATAGGQNAVGGVGGNGGAGGDASGGGIYNAAGASLTLSGTMLSLTKRTMIFSTGGYSHDCALSSRYNNTSGLSCPQRGAIAGLSRDS